MRRQLAGEVEVRRGEDEVTPGAVDLVEERLDRGESDRRAQRVEPRQSLVPLALEESGEHAVADAAGEVPRWAQAEPEGRDARCRQQVGIGEHDVEGGSGRFGGDHRPDREQ